MSHECSENNRTLAAAAQVYGRFVTVPVIEVMMAGELGIEEGLVATYSDLTV